MVRDWLSKKKYYYFLSIVHEIDCIAGFVLNCEGFIVLCYRRSACNIHNSSVSEYSTTDISNSGIDKYYVVKKNMVFLALAK